MGSTSIPLNLDGYFVSDQWQSGLWHQLRKRLAADSTGWEKDNEKFEEQFEWVVRALKTKDARPTPPEPKLRK